MARREAPGRVKSMSAHAGWHKSDPYTVLSGSYRSSPLLEPVEEVVLDGTITNLGTVVQGSECLVDVVTLHMDGTAVDAATFKGAMSIVYETRAKDACKCRFWFDYEARRSP